jgi:hypothetical protein
VSTVVILGAVLILVVFDVFASGRVVRSDVMSRGQKTAWLLLVWLVPLLGAMWMVQVSRETSPPAPAPGSLEEGPGPSLGIPGGGVIGTVGDAGECGIGPGSSCGDGNS